MGRVADDIVHFFRLRGVNILTASNYSQLIHDSVSDLSSHLSRREDFVGDLMVEVVYAERQSSTSSSTGSNA